MVSVQGICFNLESISLRDDSCPLYGVSDRVHDAFAAADTVLLELDLLDSTTLKKLTRCKRLKRGVTAKSYLPILLYNRVEKFMKTFKSYLMEWAKREYQYRNDAYNLVADIYQMVAAGWDRKKPEWLLFSLYQMCENILERPSSPTLDVYLAEKAVNEKKTIRPLESADEQCHPVPSVSKDEIIFAIGYTLDYLEWLYSNKQPFSHKKERSLSDIVKHYRCGSLDQDIFETGKSSKSLNYSAEDDQRSKQIDAKIHTDIFVKRNERIARRIKKELDEKPNGRFFIAVGTGHFFGSGNILDWMRDLGYRIKQISNGDNIKLHAKKHNFKPLWKKDRLPQDNMQVEITITVNGHQYKNHLLPFLAIIFLVIDLFH
ncbi:hypothetical protein WR25_07150 [Diploscapter pachys]|uniref:Metalloprotease TIKI homolog n=1 Tax=Diploscapter pachys TaxID=2018661 RepID=A0A2A2J2G8_9BILA|nr:hypothetical protein WR25_07150 [Diploscapter pachys]